MGDMADYYREVSDYDDFIDSVIDSCDTYSNTRRKTMSSIKKRRTTKKPILIKCGKHFINPSDIRKITEVHKSSKILYAIDFISAPNPDFTCWVSGEDIDMLLAHFGVIVSDEQ